MASIVIYFSCALLELGIQAARKKSGPNRASYANKGRAFAMLNQTWWGAKSCSSYKICRYCLSYWKWPIKSFIRFWIFLTLQCKPERWLHDVLGHLARARVQRSQPSLLSIGSGDGRPIPVHKVAATHSMVSSIDLQGGKVACPSHQKTGSSKSPWPFDATTLKLKQTENWSMRYAAVTAERPLPMSLAVSHAPNRAFTLSCRCRWSFCTISGSWEHLNEDHFHHSCKILRATSWIFSLSERQSASSAVCSSLCACLSTSDAAQRQPRKNHHVGHTWRAAESVYEMENTSRCTTLPYLHDSLQVMVIWPVGHFERQQTTHLNPTWPCRKKKA